MYLKPIGQETQIEDLLLGANPAQYESVKMKIDFTKKNIESVLSVNGSKVYNQCVNGEDINYQLRPNGECYYYPIQYATIQFFDNKP